MAKQITVAVFIALSVAISARAQITNASVVARLNVIFADIDDTNRKIKATETDLRYKQWDTSTRGTIIYIPFAGMHSGYNIRVETDGARTIRLIFSGSVKTCQFDDESGTVSGCSVGREQEFDYDRSRTALKNWDEVLHSLDCLSASNCTKAYKNDF